jgi:hypothetical protein
VNRVWALLAGRPLVEPVDDLPLDTSHVPALETLAQDFTRNGYNLRRLIRLIAATEAFQRDSRAEFEITAKHESKWASFPLSRLRPEQVAGGVIQASTLTTIDANANIIRQLDAFGKTTDFVRRYGDMGEDEFADRGGTITQRLLMMNGQLVDERTDEKAITLAVTRLAQLASDDDAIESAYLATLTRRPTADERAAFRTSLEHNKSGDARSRAIQDMYWVLLNSTEFSWNH